YWDLTTKAEAILLIGDAPRAAECFKAALACPDAVEGSAATTRLQLLRLSAANVPGAREMLDMLRVGSVGVYIGSNPSDGHRPAPETRVLRDALLALFADHRFGHIHGGLAAG